jgi:hypothetical protein
MDALRPFGNGTVKLISEIAIYILKDFGRQMNFFFFFFFLPEVTSIEMTTQPPEILVLRMQ